MCPQINIPALSFKCVSLYLAIFGAQVPRAVHAVHGGDNNSVPYGTMMIPCRNMHPTCWQTSDALQVEFKCRNDPSLRERERERETGD